MTVNFIEVGSDFSGNAYNTKISSDGSIWFDSTDNPFSVIGNNVAYGQDNSGNGRWIMVGIDNSNNNIKYSDNDGVTWNNASSNSFTGFYGNGRNIHWGEDAIGNKLWVAVGGDSSGNTIKYSSDGSTWIDVSTNTFFDGSDGNGQGRGVAWGGDAYTIGKWIAVGGDSSGNTIKYSSDGKIWNNVTSNQFSLQGENVGWGIDGAGKSQWVSVGQDSGGNTIKYSSDGVTWYNVVSNAFSYTGNGCVWGIDNLGNYKWVAVGQDNSGNNIKYSSDGINWNNVISNQFNNIGYDVTWGIDNSGNRLWVAVGGNGSTVTTKYSYDAINWVNASSNAISGSGTGIGSRFTPPHPSPPPPPPKPKSNCPCPVIIPEQNGSNITRTLTQNQRAAQNIRNSRFTRGSRYQIIHNPTNLFGTRSGAPLGTRAPPKNTF
jgi:hypothetical protein